MPKAYFKGGLSSASVLILRGGGGGGGAIKCLSRVATHYVLCEFIDVSDDTWATFNFSHLYLNE